MVNARGVGRDRVDEIRLQTFAPLVIAFSNLKPQPVPKTPKNEPATEENAVSGDSAAAPTKTTARAPKKRAGVSKTTAKKKAGAKTKPGSRPANKSGAKKRSTPAEAAEPSDADIRLRAYFIAERRVQLALQGDPARDWIEARQQLIEEARQPRS